jgi:hypothetical protein
VRKLARSHPYFSDRGVDVAYNIGSAIKEILDRFMTSADEEIGQQHLPARPPLLR